MSVNGCCQCVSHANHRWPAKSETLLLPNVSWNSLQLPHDQKQMKDKWMNVHGSLPFFTRFICKLSLLFWHNSSNSIMATLLLTSSNLFASEPLFCPTAASGSFNSEPVSNCLSVSYLMTAVNISCRQLLKAGNNNNKVTAEGRGKDPTEVLCACNPWELYSWPVQHLLHIPWTILVLNNKGYNKLYIMNITNASDWTGEERRFALKVAVQS